MNITFQPLSGYAYGAIQPSIGISFSAPFHVSTKLRLSLEVLCDQAAALRRSGSNSPNDADTGSDLLPDLIVRTTDHLSALAGDQRFTATTWMKEGESLQCVIPTLSPTLITWLVRTVLNEIGKRSEALSKHDCQQFIAFLTKKARPYLPAGTNASSLIQSAAERRIPFKIFDRKLLILGYGAGTHILNSSLTDDESINAVSMAKDKVTTNQFLSLSGFPVAQQAIVNSCSEALSFAERNGYPIVLKPRAEEQGRGVHTFLNSAQEVSDAYEVLKADYKRIIAEKHYFGDGYRVYVLDGQVVRVRKLSAAHVVGDGVQTVSQLIELENTNPKRGAIYASIKQIVVDDDVLSLLKKQSKSLSSIPDKDEKVLLSPTSNLSRGGTSEDYLDQLHPANSKLSIDVTKAMGLKCSGVDLISIDASKPWQENNAIVCEVNAQPQIGSVGRVDMHDMIIDRAGIEMLPVRLFVGQDGAKTSIPLFDRSQSRLDVHVTAKSILASGSPVQYFDQLTIDPNLPAEQIKRLNQLLVSVRSISRPMTT